MCGINGFNWKNQKIIEFMNNVVDYRGPDGKGIYLDKNVSLGHRRLSIIDTTIAGHQPMFYSKESGGCSKKYNRKNLKKSRVVITYNGEIYNYKNLKKNLIKKGYSFSTQTDTEVVLASYLEWGEECIKKFNGMWAFCIYDYDKQKLLLSRDRFGIKPLYYYSNKEKFIFSSEIKGIIKNRDVPVILNKGAFIEYFHSSPNLSFVSESMFENIKAVPPGSNLSFDLIKKKISQYAYDSFPYGLSKKKYLDNTCRKEKYLINKLDKTLNEAVRRHMEADVEVSSICSGGLDSSLITAIAKKYNPYIKIYSVDTCDKKTSEIRYARKVAKYLNLNLKEVKIKKRDYSRLLGKNTFHLESPLSHPNTIAMYLLFKKISQDKVKVALSGEGADEIFGGYTQTVQIKTINSFKKRFNKYLKNKLNLSNNKINTLFFGLSSCFFNYRTLRYLFTNQEVLRGHGNDGITKYKNEFGANYLKNIEEKYEFLNPNEKSSEVFLSKQLREYLVPLLKRSDKIGMAKSVEVRSPYLDDNLIKFTSNLPLKYKIKGINRKYLLKKVSERYLPKSIVYRKKSGFPLPFKKWYGVEEINIDLKEKFFSEFKRIFLN